MGKRSIRWMLARPSHRQSGSAYNRGKKMTRRRPFTMDRALGFVSGRRFSDAVSSRASAPLGAGNSGAWKAALFFCATALVFVAHPATAADLALLRNGFSIRHEHRLVMGSTTRLYFGSDDSSFTDVPTEEIASYEKDLSLPVPSESQAVSAGSLKSASAISAPALSQVVLSEVVDTASATYHLDPDLVNSV